MFVCLFQAMISFMYRYSNTRYVVSKISLKRVGLAFLSYLFLIVCFTDKKRNVP